MLSPTKLESNLSRYCYKGAVGACLACLLLQPSSEQQSPKGREFGLSPFHLPLPWDLTTFPTFLQQAATSSGSFTLLNVVGLAHLQPGGCSAGLTASVPEVPYLSSVGSGLGASFPQHLSAPRRDAGAAESGLQQR